MAHPVGPFFLGRILGFLIDDGVVGFGFVQFAVIKPVVIGNQGFEATDFIF